MTEKSKSPLRERADLLTKRATAAIAFMGVLGSGVATARATTSSPVVREVAAVTPFTSDETLINLQAKADMLKLGKEIVGFRNINPDKPNSFVRKTSSITRDTSGSRVCVTDVIVKHHNDSRPGVYAEYKFEAVMPISRSGRCSTANISQVSFSQGDIAGSDVLKPMYISETFARNKHTGAIAVQETTMRITRPGHYTSAEESVHPYYVDEAGLTPDSLAATDQLFEDVLDDARWQHACHLGKYTQVLVQPVNTLVTHIDLLH